MSSDLDRMRPFSRGLRPLVALACFAALAGCAGGADDAADDDPGIVDLSTHEADQLRETERREDAGDEEREGGGDRR